MAEQVLVKNKEYAR